MRWCNDPRQTFKHVFYPFKLRRLFLLAVALALPLGLPYGRGQPKCSEQNRFEAILAKGSNVKTSVTVRESALREAIKLCTQNPTAYENLSTLLLREYDYQRALRWAHRGLRIDTRKRTLLLAQGIALLSAGKPEKALPVFKNLPSEANTEFYLGMTYRALRDHKAARDALAKSFALGYHDPYVLYVLIDQDHDLHDTQAGLKAFQTLDQNFPHSPWLHLLLGNAYSARNDVTHAEVEYQNAAAIDRTIPIVHFKLGHVNFNRSNYAAAIQDFRRENKINLSFGEAYLYLGTTLRSLGKNQEALPYVEKAVARDPNSALVYNELATAQIQARQPQRAIQTLQEGERRFPGEAAFSVQLSCLMKALGDVHSAAKQAVLAESLSRKDNVLIPAVTLHHTEAKQGAPLDPELQTWRQCLAQEDVRCASQALSELSNATLQKNPEYLNLKAQTLSLKKEQKQALEVIQRALAADPDRGAYWLTQGRIYQRLGNQTLAIKSFLRAEQLRANPAEAVYYIGMSFFLLGNYYDEDKRLYRRAAEHFKMALKLDPHFDKAEFMLGAINSIESKYPQAKLDLERALQMNPQNPYYLLHYGILLRRLGDTAGAMHEMKLAEKYGPTYPRTYFSLGALEAQIGNDQEAKEQLEAGLRLNKNYPKAYYTLGHVYHRLGLETKSREAFRKFQQLKTEKQEEESPLGVSIHSAGSLSALHPP